MARAIYTITAPDGTEFDLEGPANATPEQIKAEASKAFSTFTAPRERPPVDPASANRDPRDVQAGRRPAPATTPFGIAKEIYNVGGMRDVVQGARDLYEGGRQLGVRGLRTVGLADQSTVDNVDREVRRVNSEFEYDTGSQPGEFRPFRAAGNIVATAPLLPARLASAASLPGRIAGNAVIGGAAGALQPVTQTEDFGWEKSKQVGMGAGAAAVATPVAEGLVRVAVPVVNRVATFVRSLGRQPSQAQIDNLISQELDQQGVRFAGLGDDVRNALRQDVRSALQTGDTVDASALRRLADVRAVGATPTRGAVTLDPVQITAERNLAKVGANSTDPQLQQLAQIEAGNNRALIDRVNTLGAGRASSEFNAGQQITRALRGVDEARGARVTQLYDEARALNGGDIPLDGVGFVNNASRALDAQMRGAFLPAEFRGILQSIADGRMPMNIATQEQLRTMLATAQRGAQDGNTRAALGIVRDALEGIAPVQSASRAVGPAIPGGQGGADEVTAAFNRARTAHRARMDARERTPALAAAVDDAQPDAFVRDYVLKAKSARDLAALREAAPEVGPAARAQVVNYLKQRALSGAADEVGTFSQSGYNRALREIGNEKLAALGFSVDDIAALQQVGRASSYLQIQPKGSAVNNSNTAAAAAGALDRILSRVPVIGEFIRSPTNSYLAARAARNALRSELPVTGQFIDEPTRNALIRSPFGLPFGAAAAQD
jgi:hypothetical protein